jgi:hypothetical protein
MDERDFYNETTTSRAAELNCPHCHSTASYGLRWVLRRKKDKLPPNADERDRARFAKAQSYMVLSDDKVMCTNSACRKRFDVSGIKTMAFLSEEQESEMSSRPRQSEQKEKPQEKQGQPRQEQRKQRSQQQRGRGNQQRRRGGQQAQRGNQQDQRGRRQGQGPRGNRDDNRGNQDDNRGNRDDNWGNRQEYWANQDSRGAQHGHGVSGRRGGKPGQQQGQKKGKKKRPQVYFPSDYVNYRP